LTKTITFLVALLLSARTVAAQSKVYTNRDLTPRPVTAWTRTVTPEELRGLESRQFKLPLELPDGPTVIYVSQRVDPQPLPPYRPLSEPWSMTTYVGSDRRGSSGGSHRHGATVVSRTGIHLRYPYN
jgi:hypothetical protein